MLHNWQKSKGEKAVLRKRELTLLEFARELADEQNKVDTLFLMMNPAYAAAWRMPAFMRRTSTRASWAL